MGQLTFLNYCITNYGILWSDSTTDEKWIYWSDFIDVSINYVAGDYSKPGYVSINKWTLQFGDSSKHVTEFLISVQQFLRSLRDKTEKYDLLIRKDADFTPNMVQLFDGYLDASVYSSADENLAEIARIKYPKEKNGAKTVVAESIDCFSSMIKYIVSFDSVNTSFMIIDNRMYINDGLTIRIINVEQIVSIKQIDNDATGFAELVIYSESSQKISIHIPAMLPDKILSEMNEWIYWLSPFKHATYFSQGLVVDKDYDKAMELYQLAAIFEDNVDKCYIAIGEVLEDKKLFLDAYKFYRKAEELSGSDEQRPIAYYKIARLYYEHSNLTFHKSYDVHYNAVYYMNIAAEKGLFDAKDRLLLILNDDEWMIQARNEAKSSSFQKKRLAEICKLAQSGVGTVDYSKTASQTMHDVSSFLKKASKSFFGKK